MKMGLKMRRLLCAAIAAALCVTAAVCASKAPLRRVYSNVPEKLQKAYYFEIQRDTETGTDYLVLIDAKGNPVDFERRDDAKGDPFTASAITSK